MFEDPAIKEQVWKEIEPHLAPDALLGSNTSTLPITDLAENVTRPADFIGLHFFSPVDKMPLLEIIKGEKTGDDAVYRALDLSKQIKKTPIVVNDSRGFFTSRVIGTFINEGIAMLAEGIPARVDRAGVRPGRLPRPRAPAQRRAEHGADGEDPQGRQGGRGGRRPDVGRPSRVRGHRPDARAGARRQARAARASTTTRTASAPGLWKGLAQEFPVTDDPVSIAFKDLEERMLFIESIETVKCLDEGVIETVSDANIGSIFGIGFPGWTGGVLQYVNGYDGGVAGFVERARELAATYGDRFEPPASLVAKAESGELYLDETAVPA